MLAPSARLMGLLVPLVGASALIVAAVLRIGKQELFAGAQLEPVLFPGPPTRVPLLDLLAWPLPSDHRLSLILLLSLLGVAVTGVLVRQALPEGGRVLAMALTAVCPALVLSGAIFRPQVLVILCAAASALYLVQVLRSSDQGLPVGLLLASTCLLLSDWPAWSPVLAWLGWLLFFRPTWLEPARAKRALLGLGGSAALGGLGYGIILALGAQPAEVLGASSFPLGQEGVEQLLGSLSGLWLGKPTGEPLLLRIGIAGGLIGAAIVGWRRAHRAGAPAWGSVLMVGSLGALVPALAIHPGLPFAAYKNLWFMTPMLIGLSIASVWPIAAFGAEDHRGGAGRKPALGTALALLGLALFGASCIDEDEDGWAIQRGDCDDENPTVHPEAPEIWGDDLDNDCDGVVDWSETYQLLEEVEPNDSSLGSCFAPEGQDLGRIAGEQLLTRIQGRIDDVVAQSYEEGDRDCFSFRVPDVEDHPHLTMHLSWDDEESDLDLALYGLWEGAQAGFAQSQDSGPGPEALVSSSGFDSGAPLWIWVVGYDGPPSDYQLDLVLR